MGLKRRLSVCTIAVTPPLPLPFPRICVRALEISCASAGYLHAFAAICLVHHDDGWRFCSRLTYAATILPLVDLSPR
jgi:hypothetical protein